ncbi:MAG: S1 RNA-binding domain-containing protein, partial [Pseudomonadota bacterium]
VTNFGIFVELSEVFVDGLVHITALGNDYFHFDATRHQLSGERTRMRFRLGDAVRVRVMRVDLDEAQIDFELASKPKVLNERAVRGSPKRAKKRSGGKRVDRNSRRRRKR